MNVFDPKYRQVLSISWSNGFIYRLNFVMWRVRNVLQLLTIYYLWFAVLSHTPNAFGYSKAQLLTYIIGTSLMRALVFSSQSNNIQADIGNGDLVNYLVKPVNYFKYWLSRDAADKLLNLAFSVVELSLLFILIKPPLIPPSSLFSGMAFLIAAVLAMFMYFFFSCLISFTVFWIPEGNGWPQRFFITVILEFLSGGLFPLDILPGIFGKVISALPTAYFLNTPLQIYLGRISPSQTIVQISFMGLWLAVLYVASKILYQKGLRVFGAYGR